MSRRLIIIHNDSIIGIQYVINHSIIYNNQYVAESWQRLENILPLFFKDTCLTFEQIDAFCIAIDFMDSIDDALASDIQLGYIKLVNNPYNSESNHETFLTNLNQLNVVSIYNFNNLEKQLKKAIDYFETQKIKKIAFNTSLNHFEHNNIVKYFKTIQTSTLKTFDLFIANTLEEKNFSVRENTLILNLILSSIFIDYAKVISNIMKTYNSNLPIYFLKGDGTFMDFNQAKSSPIDTWHCIKALKSINASQYFDLQHCLLIYKHLNKFRVQQIKNYEPVCNRHRAKFKELELSPKYIKYIEIEKSEIRFLDEMLTQIDLTLSSIPIVYNFNHQITLQLFDHPIYQIPENKLDYGKGMSIVPFRINKSMILSDSEEKSLKSAQAQLESELLDYLAQENISISNIKIQFTEYYWQYTINKVVFLKLDLTGWI